MHHLNSYFILQQFDRGVEYGRISAVTLFLDISGFTHITETLMEHRASGAEALANIIAQIFEPLVGCIYSYGGDITHFAGDAFQAIFPFTEAAPEDVLARALAAARFIQQQMEHHSLFQTTFGTFEFTAKVGLSVGEVEWGILSGPQQHVYYFRGTAVDECTVAENLGRGGDLVLHRRLYEQVSTWVTAAALPENGDYWRVTAVNRQHPPPETSAPLSASARHTAQFSLQSLIDSEIKAEFRYTCNLFLNVANIHTHEEISTFMQTFFAALQPYDGYFNRMAFGDKGCHLLLFWGAPTTHENDIHRALNFALRLYESTPFPVRIGITYGFSHAGFIGSSLREEFTCYGHRVNMAARLMSKAPWGSIWLDETILPHAQSDFLISHYDNIPLKGVRSLQPVYALRGWQKEIEQTAQYTTKIIGRIREMAQLHNSILPIFHQQFAGVITIYGEAGIGKSRLVHELRQQLNLPDDPNGRKKFHWLYCPVDEILRQPLNPFRYWLRNYFQQSRANTEAQNKQLFSARLRTLSAQLKDQTIINELERTASILGALVDLYWPNSLYDQLEPRLRAENTRLALINLIKAETTLQPVILEIEDGHWLDNESKNLLGMITRTLSSQPLAVVLTNRYQDDGTIFELPVETAVPQHEIHLTYLDYTAVAELAEQTVNGRLASQIIQFLIEKTNGNPFFAEQLLLDLKERSYLQRDNSQTPYQFRASFHPQDVPANLRAVLISRLDRLVQETRHVVQMAAVLGQEFDVSILKNMHVETNANDDLADVIRQAESEQIWEAISKIIYAFKHALMRDAAYSMQIQARLQQLHALAALAYETVYAGTLADHYPSLAYHYEQAAIPAKAAQYLKLAGDAAKNSYQNELALDFYNRLLKYPLEQQTQLDILSLQGEIFYLQGQWHPAIMQLNKGVTLAQKLNALQKEAELRIQLATVLCDMGQYDEAITTLEESILLSEKIGNRQMLANTLIVMSRTYMYNDNFDKALPLAEKAYQLHLANGDQMGIATALSVLGGNYGMTHQYKEGLYYFQESIRIFEQINEQVQIMRPIHNAGVTYYFLGNFPRAASFLERAAVQSEKIGDRVSIYSAYFRLGQLYHANDRIDRAVFYFEKSVTIYRELGNSGVPSSPVPYLAWAYVSDKQYANALRTASQHLENIRTQNRDVEHGLVYMVIGLLLTEINIQEAPKELLELLTDFGQMTHLAATPDAYFQIAIDEAREKNYLDTLIPALTYYGSFLSASNPDVGLNLLREAKQLAKSHEMQWSQRNIANHCARLGIDYDSL